jgi:hypothetical protein
MAVLNHVLITAKFPNTISPNPGDPFVNCCKSTCFLHFLPFSLHEKTACSHASTQ